MSGAQKRIVAGIDEAGLGPMLGPLTLGLCVLRVPEDGAANEWERLSAAVTDRVDGDSERLVVADSKVVYTRNPRGRARLERTVLAFHGARSAGGTQTVESLFEDASPELRPGSELLARHPWYSRLPGELPAWGESADLEPYRARLCEALEGSGTEVLELFPRLVPAGQLNADFARTENKSVTTWGLCADLIRHVWERHGEHEPELVVDRQGGRLRYAPLLWEHLPDTWIETRAEARTGCDYLVHGKDGRRMRVVFRERAEETSFAVALASCTAKYLRELSMEGFNAYFAGLQKGLRPTAGYVTDARRWLEEAGPALEQADLDPDVLVRER